MREKGRERLALGAAILLTAVLALLSVRVGSYPLSTGQILDILSGGLAGTTPAHVLWNLRLPRVGMGLLAGWALGIAVMMVVIEIADRLRSRSHKASPQARS